MFPTLPLPPTPEELQRHIPSIPPVGEGVYRPFWSVMIPTYNCAHYLRRTLESVLRQDPGPDQMQIEVVDDVSTKDDPEAVVSELGAGRVQFYCQPSNQGATRTFNTCIRRARGHWVHILHGDDMVMPDFYANYRKIIEDNPPMVMVLGRVVTIDEDDRWVSIFGPMQAGGTPIFNDFLARQATEQQGQFAGVVVKREAYERAGGFCTAFSHVADMDMWFRIGQLGPVGLTERPFAFYRSHPGSDTSRLMLSANNIKELYMLICNNSKSLIDNSRSLDEVGWRSRLANFAEDTAWRLDSLGAIEGRLNQFRWAWMLWPNVRRFRCLAKSWIKHRVRRFGLTSPC